MVRTENTQCQITKLSAGQEILPGVLCCLTTPGAAPVGEEPPCRVRNLPAGAAQAQPRSARALWGGAAPAAALVLWGPAALP